MAGEQNSGVPGTPLPGMGPGPLPATTDEPLYPAGFGVALQAYSDRITAHMAERKTSAMLAQQEVNKINSQIEQLRAIEVRLAAVLAAYNLDTQLTTDPAASSPAASSPAASSPLATQG